MNHHTITTSPPARQRPHSTFYILHSTLAVAAALILSLALPACDACKPPAASPAQSHRIIKVTTLAADGEGTLKAALNAEGPRIIVFEVGGVIDWRMDEINVKNGHLTIAGETAPTPGITIIRGSLNITAPHVIVRHIRVRSGDGADLKKPSTEIDSITANGPDAHDILFDHCSTAWAIDENLSVSGPRVKNGTSARVTLRNCIIAEGLDNSTHPKGPHSKGTLIHDFVRGVAIIGCLYAHNYNRHPYIKPNATVFMANNLIYNPGNAAIHFAYTPQEYQTIPDPMLPSDLTAIGNVYRMGADTLPNIPFITCSPAAPKTGVPIGNYYERDTLVYAKDGALLWSDASGSAELPLGESTKTNVHAPTTPGAPAPTVNSKLQTVNPGGEAAGTWLADPRLTRVAAPVVPIPKNFTPLPASQTETHVLKNAGARPKDRDPVDLRIVADYQARKGRIIDSQAEVGGYPTPAPATRKLTIPDGGPAAIEAWLARYRAEVEY